MPSPVRSLLRPHVLLIIAVVVYAFSTYEAETKDAVPQPPASEATAAHILELATRFQQNNDFPLRQTTVNDPVYQQTKTYEGYDFKDVLLASFDVDHIDLNNASLRLECADGYVASMALRDALAGQGLLAVRDVEAGVGNAWMHFKKGNQLKTPAPFYLVWAAAEIEKKHWTYQLVRIELQVDQNRDQHLLPGDDETAKIGYTIFRDRCVACHSINLTGGVLGMELNVPKNVTEYWDREHLRAYIKNPESYRAGSKMPPFAYLSERQMDSLLYYLEVMKSRKIEL